MEDSCQACRGFGVCGSLIPLSLNSTLLKVSALLEVKIHLEGGLTFSLQG